jgi:hypothetical protein
VINIQEGLKKINPLAPNQEKLLLSAIIILLGLAGFGLGRLSVLMERRQPVKITSESSIPLSSLPTDASDPSYLPQDTAQ